MHRRDLLRSVAGGTIPAVASGCLLGGGSAAGSVEDVSMHHSFGGHSVRVDEVDGAARDPTAFGDLPADARREIAIAIAQGWYQENDRELALLDHLSVESVRYRGHVLTVSVSPIDVWRHWSDDARSDPDWTTPVELDATIGADGLTLTLENVGDGPLDVVPSHHSGTSTTYPPLFGPLIAWAGDPHVLGHDDYARNDRIVTDGDFFYYDWSRHPGEVLDEGREIDLAPGDALEDTYRIPDDLAGDATVWLSLYYGGEGVEGAEPDSHFGINWTITLSL